MLKIWGADDVVQCTEGALVLRRNSGSNMNASIWAAHLAAIKIRNTSR